MFKVIQVIEGREGNLSDITFFQGSDKVKALAALVSAAASDGNDPWFTVKSVRFDIVPDPDPWDQWPARHDSEEPPF